MKLQDRVKKIATELGYTQKSVREILKAERDLIKGLKGTEDRIVYQGIGTFTSGSRESLPYKLPNKKVKKGRKIKVVKGESGLSKPKVFIKFKSVKTIV